MPYYFIHWTDAAIEHIEEHGVTTAEFEEVVMFPEWTGYSRSSGRNAAKGWTSTGKYLFCTFDLDDEGTVLYPATAYEVDPWN